MNTAAKGRTREHRSRQILEAAGYQVTRAAGSLGDWDLICSIGGEIGFACPMSWQFEPRSPSSFLVRAIDVGGRLDMEMNTDVESNSKGELVARKRQRRGDRPRR